MAKKALQGPFGDSKVDRRSGVERRISGASVTGYVHQHFPKMVYIKGAPHVVNSEAELDALDADWSETPAPSEDRVAAVERINKGDGVPAPVPQDVRIIDARSDADDSKAKGKK